jgi:hypothetical protein
MSITLVKTPSVTERLQATLTTTVLSTQQHAAETTTFLSTQQHATETTTFLSTQHHAAETLHHPHSSLYKLRIGATGYLSDS